MTQPARYRDEQTALYLGDALNTLPTLADASIDAIVCDPPYELGFMGKAWDSSGIAYNVDLWRQCWRVLKPGGHLLAFGGTRTYHRMTVAIEDAGFEIRDSLHWIYGSGMPKSLDVSKAIDKAAGAERQVIGQAVYGDGHVQRSAESIGYGGCDPEADLRNVTAPATQDAARWQGWGTALKPAHEPIVLARKLLTGTVAGNVLRHGTGALNIDACRTEACGGLARGGSPRGHRSSLPMNADRAVEEARECSPEHPAGRWPTNVLLAHPPLLDDHGQPIGDACAEGCVTGCPVAEMDAQTQSMRASKPSKSGSAGRDGGAVYGGGKGLSLRPEPAQRADAGASRFFPVFRYEAKAPTKERPRLADGTAHTTVKPLALMQWLVRLVTPPGGLVLDPFAGSGTTLEACRLEGLRSVGIEMDATHAELCRVRLRKPYMTSLFDDPAPA